MSRFSGKCDFFDHLLAELPEATDELDVELKCFDKLKERTGGKVYQSFLLELTPLNIDTEIANINNSFILDKKEFTREVSDKRYKDGIRKEKYYKYYRFGKEFSSLKQLNKLYPYYAKRAIILNDIYDAIPYYSYTISALSSTVDGEYIELSSESYIDTKEKKYRYAGIIDANDRLNYYRQELKQHLLEVANYEFYTYHRI